MRIILLGIFIGVANFGAAFATWISSLVGRYLIFYTETEGINTTSCAFIHLRDKRKTWYRKVFFGGERRGGEGTADNQNGTCCEFQAPCPCCQYLYRPHSLKSYFIPYTSVQSNGLCNNTETLGLLFRMAIFQLTSLTRQIGNRQIYLCGLVKTSYSFPTGTAFEIAAKWKLNAMIPCLFMHLLSLLLFTWSW